MPDENERWDEALAQWLVGKYVLVGLTYVDQNGEVISKAEVHGRVKSADRLSNIVLDRTGQNDDLDFKLPPDTAVFGPGGPGEYRLHSSGEVVKNPDALATWVIKSPMVTEPQTRR